MPHAAKRKTDLIIGRGLISAETVASELRSRLVNRITRERSHFSESQLLQLARNILAEFEPLLAQNLFDTEIASWVSGVQYVANLMPAPVEQAIASSNGGSGRPPVDVTTLFYPPDEPEPFVRFPLFEEAAQSLADRKILTRWDFDQLAANVKHQAFTVAGQQSTETIGKIRDALRDAIQEGPSLRVFKENLSDVLDASPIGPGHLETIYRTNIQTAFSAGRDSLAENPIVASVFQYREYIAIHDGRVDPQHLALESLGLNGTGIYRADDPFWDYFTPPWRYNCILPGNILQGRIEMLARSWYAGEAVEIVTAAGKRLRVTVNHPVLTADGFVAAGLLKQSDNVLSYFGIGYGSGRADNAIARSGSLSTANDSRRASPQVNVHHFPANIEQVFASLALKRPMCRMPVEADDLHGEARFGKGYVDIVGPDSELPLRLESMRGNGGGNFRFTDANSLALGSGNSGQRFGANLSPASGIPGGTALPGDGRGVLLEQSPLSQLRIGSAAYLDASRYELPVESRAIAAGLAGQFLERSPGAVSLDKITEVRRYNFSGHVYDAQAAGGWIVANGVIVSNCRCGVNLLTIEAAARKGVREAQEWQRTGEPPANPEWRLDYIPFRPAPGWGNKAKLVA